MPSKRTPPNRLDLDTAEIVSAYEAGEPEQAIARRLGVSRTAIRQRLLEGTAAIRSYSEAQRVSNAGKSRATRKRQTRAANEAAKGRKASLAELVKRAQTCEREQTHTTEAERYFARLLNERGVETVLAKAVGPYNIDIAAEPVAVEIFGGHWHGHGRHAARAPKRFRHLADGGWAPLVVWVHETRAPLTDHAADYVASFVELARRNPSARREYRVIWGTGEDVTGAVPDLDHITLKPPLRRSKRERS